MSIPTPSGCAQEEVLLSRCSSLFQIGILFCSAMRANFSSEVRSLSWPLYNSQSGCLLRYFCKFFSIGAAFPETLRLEVRFQTVILSPPGPVPFERLPLVVSTPLPSAGASCTRITWTFSLSPGMVMIGEVLVSGSKSHDRSFSPNGVSKGSNAMLGSAQIQMLVSKRGNAPTELSAKGPLIL